MNNGIGFEANKQKPYSLFKTKNHENQQPDLE